MSNQEKPAVSSPFHSGERDIQSRLGVRERMERFGSQVIRDHMPEQHIEFYRKLPFVFVGHADKEAWPWASILFGEPGFMASGDARTLTISALPVRGDPLTETLSNGTRLGLLGIELESRRRNRLVAHIDEISDNQIRLSVDQAFGNCPQYIQTRELERISSDSLPQAEVFELKRLDERARELIQCSDTFFVASYIRNDSGEASEGADVSHKGGRPGFVRVDDHGTLTIPDYLGNFHFNTFGNFIETPRAGLLFLDFEHGHLLTLTGTVEILWDSPEIDHFSGAERLWKFHLDHGRWLNNALPLRWKLDEYSPNTLLTGTWDEAEKLCEAEKQKNQWLPYTVTKVVKESSVIRSFHLESKGHHQATFKPGQFLTVKAAVGDRGCVKSQEIRTYTISNAPADANYRISVKRETSVTAPDGVFSNFLHDQIEVGDTIAAKAPCGAFTFDVSIDRPAVLLAAGVGITPMISMARHALLEGVRTRSIRPTTIFAAASDQDQRAFFAELNRVSETSGGQINVYWVLSKVHDGMKLGRDFHEQGRITKELLQSVLPLDDYDFFLCGPAGFMQSMYDMLRCLAVNDCRIHTEEFGPASLKRDVDLASTGFEKVAIASEAIIQFTDSGVEQAWSQADGTLLEFAESHGFTPEFGCRSGQCGACRTNLVSGKIGYQTETSAMIEEGEILLCCAVPAAIEDSEVPRISLGL